MKKESEKTTTRTVRTFLISEKLKAGMALNEIAAELGMSTSEVSDLAEAEAENEQMKKEIELKLAIVRLYEQGMTNDEIASLQKISVSDVNKAVSEYHSRMVAEKIVLERPLKEKFNEIDPDKFFQLNAQERMKRNDDVKVAYENGLDIKQVAAKYFLKPGMVYYILRTSGVKIREKQKPVKVRRKIKQKVNGNAYKRFLKIKELFEAGKGFKEIGGQMNMNHRSVWNLLRQKGVVGLRRDTLRQLAEDMVNLYKEGVSREELCERFNKDMIYVTNVLRRKGFVFRDEERVKKIVESYLNGKTVDEVAAEFDISRQRVQRILRNEGIRYTRYNEDTRNQISAMYKEGVKIYDIANNLSMTPSSVITNLTIQGAPCNSRQLPGEKGTGNGGV